MPITDLSLQFFPNREMSGSKHAKCAIGPAFCTLYRLTAAATSESHPMTGAGAQSPSSTTPVRAPNELSAIVKSCAPGAPSKPPPIGLVIVHSPEGTPLGKVRSFTAPYSSPSSDTAWAVAARNLFVSL